MKEYLKALSFVVMIVFLGSVSVIVVGMFLLFKPPHVPSLNEIIFKWRLGGEIDSPMHIKQLTNFDWKNVCIKDYSDWLTEDMDKGSYILVFHDHKQQPIDTFYFDKHNQSNLGLHVGGCFLPEQRFFHKIGD